MTFLATYQPRQTAPAPVPASPPPPPPPPPPTHVLPSPIPTLPAILPAADAVAQLFALATPGQVDEALDYAARVQRATVGEFVAAPSAVGAAGLPGIDLAIEFFVPPMSAETLASEADRALTRRSLEYAAARRSEQVRPLRITPVPPGTFHQWRMVWKTDAEASRRQRWAADRRVLESVLHQARVGWREFVTGD